MPASFATAAGDSLRTWKIDITVGTILRLNKVDGMPDLRNVLANNRQLWLEIVGDPLKLMSVVYEILRPEMQAASLSEEQFAGMMDGNTIDAITTAFEEALVNFSPPQKRGPMRKALEKEKDAMGRAMKRAEERIEKTDLASKAEKLVDAEADKLDKKLANTSTGDSSAA